MLRTPVWTTLTQRTIDITRLWEFSGNWILSRIYWCTFIKKGLILCRIAIDKPLWPGLGSGPLPVMTQRASCKATIAHNPRKRVSNYSNFLSTHVRVMIVKFSTLPVNTWWKLILAVQFSSTNIARRTPHAKGPGLATVGIKPPWWNGRAPPARTPVDPVKNQELVRAGPKMLWKAACLDVCRSVKLQELPSAGMSPSDERTPLPGRL